MPYNQAMVNHFVEWRDCRMKTSLPHDHGQNIEQILERMPEEARIQEASAIFQQLCDGSRLRIFWLLCHCEECGTNIASAVNMSTATVSHHLRTLKLHGLISSRRAGKEVYYTLSKTKLARLTHQMLDDVFEMTCQGDGIESR